MTRRFLLIILALFLAAGFLRLAYLYREVGKGIAAGENESPAVFYGRPLEIHRGDHVGSIRLVERLARLSYKKVPQKPMAAGSFSQGQDYIRIFPHNRGNEKKPLTDGPVDIAHRDGRIVSLTSSAGKSLETLRLEPEEIGRILGPKMESRQPIALSAVSSHLQNAVIAAEDTRFYSHFGIDLLAVGRALFANVKEQRFAEGGSTLTQQLAKNFFLSPQKTIARKLREAELALTIELRYSKKQILEMYLNKIYFGQDGSHGIYGVEEAANFYFSKHARDLTIDEAALIAGIIHSPNRYALFRNPKPAMERRNKVLVQMRNLDMITDRELERALQAPLRLRSRVLPPQEGSYFVDYIQRITKDELGSEKYYQAGYRYYTTLDPIQQAIAEEAVAEGIAAIERKAFRAGEPLQAALVAVDPQTGTLTAMVGGRSYAQTHFNRAIDAVRQPGSAFKPFVLLAALAQAAENRGKMTLSTLISAEPITLTTPEGQPWSPSNFEDKKYGMITMRKAIEDSVNTATTRLAHDVGFEEVVKTARLAGIKRPLKPVPSLPLGSFEVTPMELAYAYTSLASAGIRFEPFSLFSVTTAQGASIIERKIQSKRVFDPRVTYLTSYALQGVLVRGTAYEAKALGFHFPAAGKTGTTNSNRDSWFVGYTPDVVCVVWVGYDAGADTGLTGAAGALRIWTRFMRSFYSRTMPTALAVPDGIETALIDPETGYLATESCPKKITEAYLAGTAPDQTCSEHAANPVMKVLRKKMRDAGDFFRNLFK